MDDDGLFGEIEQDNNPLFYSSSTFANPYNLLHDGPSLPRQPQTSGANPHMDFSSTALVNSSLGLSQKIKKMLNNTKLRIDVILTERLVNSNVIVYLIELRLDKQEDAIIVKRRYSEFKSLRDNLVKLFPTTIIPPIPEKHTLITYLINSIDNSKEILVIEVRKRYFRNFLRDVVFDLNPLLRNCPLLHKFLDPNYELCWENAINEPPVSMLPQNLLLSNPNDPTDQNGLYMLLPSVNGFDLDSTDNLPGLKKLNDDLHRLHNEINLFDLKESNLPELKDNKMAFGEIPVELINYEINFHQNIKVLHDLHKLNNRSVRNLKHMVNVLVELGANMNNFSLQIHELNSLDANLLSLTIERFGLTMDSSFLNFEHFLYKHVIPDWQEPIDQFVQYYYSALQLIKFYKYKLVQFKLLYKLKFNKAQELANYTNTHHSVKHLKDLNIDSPSIKSAIRKIETKQRRGGNLHTKKSWYGLFGGNKTTFSLPEENNYRQNGVNYEQPVDLSSHYQHKIQHIEKELLKLDQLIELFNGDVIELTKNLQINFDEYLVTMEKKWLTAMLDFIRAGKQLFNESLVSWNELRTFIDETTENEHGSV
ncbi:CIC11C00000000734 [Sungouiella intermedia]|uniref:CIC11C00000000734 n=1 Tax=Sungouiella intermedia TaxID=45354 RepID=A0A1L0GCB2_9ASCO|nr:CIC11C00000001347 [[Candida] intermedia]SGZ54178.1 CIC11C00000000734 [[Candida] intermedia]